MIFIPGITGTELFYEKVDADKMVWPLAILDQSYRDLDSKKIVHGLPLGWSGSVFAYQQSPLAVYRGVGKFLIEGKYRYYAFPYDWRLSNDDNAKELAAYVETVLS